MLQRNSGEQKKKCKERCMVERALHQFLCEMACFGVVEPLLETPPNIKEIYYAQRLTDSLLNAGDRFVIIDFCSPNFGSCKAFNPTIFLYSYLSILGVVPWFHQETSPNL